MLATATMYLLIFFAIVTTTSANVVKPACPDAKTVENFDFNAYGQGRWYELAKYINYKEGKAKCGYAEYTPEGEGFQIKNVDYFNGKLREIRGTGKLAPDAGTKGKMLFTFPYGPNGSFITNPVNVVFTDYNNYAVIYYCRFNEKTQSIQDFSWVLSRFKTLSPESKATVDNLIKESTYLSSAKYFWNDFSDETCQAV